jgi:hypothetical protein
MNCKRASLTFWVLILQVYATTSSLMTVFGVFLFGFCFGAGIKPRASEHTRQVPYLWAIFQALFYFSSFWDRVSRCPGWPPAFGLTSSWDYRHHHVWLSWASFHKHNHQSPLHSFVLSPLTTPGLFPVLLGCHVGGSSQAGFVTRVSSCCHVFPSSLPGLFIHWEWRTFSMSDHERSTVSFMLQTRQLLRV